MRPIKFRAQCSATKEWVYGLPTTETTLSNSISHISQFSGEQRKFGRQNVKIIPESVGQFTGLLDKNGVDIYEGDILDSSEKIPMIFEVYYQDGGFRYGTKDRSVDISFSGHNWLKNILKRFHIIGNIHENKELLP